MMFRRFAAHAARALTILLLGVTAAPVLSAQQAQSNASAPPVSASREAGPRVTESMPRVEAAFKESAPEPRRRDHTTTVTISTIVLVLALVVLVLVLI